MPISSNTIIHFTEEKNSLKGILESNFRIKYCKETIYWRESKSEIHVPMVSFCDIPLSQIKDHVQKYGKYGIGMTRAWAVKNGLNPVIYMERESNVAESYRKILSHFGKNEMPGSNALMMARCLGDILRYLKNYQGRLEREGVVHEHYRFADEREWRYVPPLDAKCKMLYVGHHFKKKGVRDQAMASLADLKLEFEPNDIKYIVIKDDSEIHEFLTHLRDVKGGKYSLRDMDRLATRILTAEQIGTDF